MIVDTAVVVELNLVEEGQGNHGRVLGCHITVSNNGNEPSHIKIPMATYIDRNGETRVQSMWADSGENGTKGVAISEGAHCKMTAVFPQIEVQEGDRLKFEVVQRKPKGRILFTYQCTGPRSIRTSMFGENILSWPFSLVSVDSEDEGKLVENAKTSSAIERILKRVDQLESKLAEALRRLDSLQDRYSLAIENTAGIPARKQTLKEVLKWLIQQ